MIAAAKLFSGRSIVSDRAVTLHLRAFSVIGRGAELLAVGAARIPGYREGARTASMSLT